MHYNFETISYSSRANYTGNYSAPWLFASRHLTLIRRLGAACVGVDEDSDQIITLLICVHQIFEINGSRAGRRSPADNFVWAARGQTRCDRASWWNKWRAMDRRFLTLNNRRRHCRHGSSSHRPCHVVSLRITHYTKVSHIAADFAFSSI